MRCVALAGMVLIAATSCSTIVGDYDFVDCSRDSSVCNDLTALLPPGQCKKYYCRSDGQGCELRIRDDNRDDKLNEQCDGDDDDCDEFIDEESDPADPGMLVQLDAHFESLAHALAGDRLVLALTRHNTKQVSSIGLVQVIEPLNGRLEPKTRCADVAKQSNDCWVSQIALAATHEEIVFAGIHGLGCGLGQLRVGVGPRESFELDFNTSDGGPAFAIDVEPEIEQECSRSLGCDGAGSPAVAMLGQAAGRHEVLLVWRAPLPTDGTCEDTTRFGVAARVFHIKGIGAGAVLTPVKQRTERLGDALASGPPVIAALDREDAPGYVVAFPAVDHIELIFLPGRSDEPNVASTAVYGRIRAPSVESLAIAAASDGRGLAIAFRAKVDGVATLQFAPLVFASNNDGDLSSIDEPIRLAVRDPIAAGPALSYAENGFALDDPRRSSGGWLVTWVEEPPGEPSKRRLMAARIGEAGRHRLGDPFQLEEGAISAPFTYLKRSGDGAIALHCGYLKDDALRLEQVTCPAARE